MRLRFKLVPINLSSYQDASEFCLFLPQFLGISPPDLGFFGGKREFLGKFGEFSRYSAINLGGLAPFGF